MFSNYLRMALRAMRRQPGYTFINVAGLGVGMACCLLIFLFVRDELAYDRFHENADRIYRVVNERWQDGERTDRAATPPGYGPALRETFPEVRAFARVYALGEMLIREGDTAFFEEGAYLVDSTAFDVFTLPLLSGDPETALTAPLSVVLSARLARKYFGDADPVGRTLEVNNGPMTVTGVLADLPPQSHLDLNMMVSFSTLYNYESAERLSNWVWQQFYTYVLLPEGYDPATLEAKLPDLLARRADPETSRNGFTYRSHLQPLTDIYLRSGHLAFDHGPRGNIRYVYTFSAIAVLILLIACFNFMNLSTARSMQRAREVGLRKAVGAHRSQLVGQFLGESVVMALVALALAIGLAAALLPAYNAFTGKALVLEIDRPGMVAGLLGLAGLVGVLAGSYPALFLSAFRPVAVLKGTIGAGGAGPGGVRRVLVVAQFAISILLLVATGVIVRQLDYMRHKDLGFARDLLVKLPLRGDMDDNLEAIKAELLRTPSITAVTASWGSPGSFAAGDDIRLPGRDASWGVNMYTVDYDFLDTYGMEIVAGRGFSRDFPSDEHEAFVLNETAARALGWTPEEAIGREIGWNMWGQDSLKQGAVIGVVRDFNYASLHQKIDPLVIHIYPDAVGQLTVRIRPDNISGSLDALRAGWSRWAPAWPFEYAFLDAQLAEDYLREAKLARLSGVFALLAIGIACLGLFGLAAFTAERRTKEIGIRKVLGASVRSVVVLLSKDFARLVGIAFVVAVPVAYLAMDRWLDDFAYRIDLGAGLFLLAGLIALAIALLTVSYHAVRAARADPVESLRYE